MFNIFKSKDEFSGIMIKQCPSCHGFIKSSNKKCKHYGNSTQQESETPSHHKESKNRSDQKKNKFSM